MVVMTNFVLLIGAGLFSQAVYQLQAHTFTVLYVSSFSAFLLPLTSPAFSVGKEVDDTGGDGPGSFDVRGSVWHLDCCNPENNYDNGGWMIFNAIFGWTNSASVGTVLAYVFYWLAVIAALVRMKWREGRTTLVGWESAAGVRRRERAERGAREEAERDAAEAEKEAEPMAITES